MSENTNTHNRHSHHSEIDIDLDSTRSDVKPLLDQLNPILQQIIEMVKAAPLEQRTGGGYHNITFCNHDDDDDCE